MDYITFKNNTLDKSLFQCEDVIGDNKCFYRSTINSLIWRYDLNKLNTSKMLISSKKFKTKNNYSLVYDDAYTPYIEKYIDPFEFQSDAIIHLENKVIKWVNKNKNRIYKPFGSYIYDIVRMTHDISVEEYVDRNAETSELWGGLIEQIAIANIYKCPIIILRPVSYNSRSKKINEGIIKGNEPNKNVRFQISQILHPDKEQNLPLYLLWKRYGHGMDHYMSLYLKDFLNEELIISNSVSL
jgi:hypothetical protein